MNQSLGIIGTGHFAGYLVEGLCRAGDGPRIVVSPRNAAVAQRLAAAFGVAIAADNQSVVDVADMVILTTRPVDGAAPAAVLDWREGQIAVTMVAGLGLDGFARACQPATAVRAMASAAVALGVSPFFLYPDHAAVRALGARLGAVQVMADEATFEAASVLPVYYALLFRIIGEATDWCIENGVEPGAARALTAMSMRGAALMATKQDDLEIESIVESLATKGGLTERGLMSLEADDAFGAWQRALDVVLRRMRGDHEAWTRGGGAMPIEIKGIDHVVLRIVDVERAIRFYCGVLGCTVERRRADIGLIQLRAGAALIDLVPVDGEIGRMGGAAAGTEARNMDHFALSIESFDKAALHAHLAAHGVEGGEVGIRYGAQGDGPSMYLRDPDGNTVELKGPPSG